MFNQEGSARRIIFRPYAPGGQRANVYICVGCGKYFHNAGDMTEMTTRFADHLCEPVFIEVEDRSLGVLKH